MNRMTIDAATINNARKQRLTSAEIAAKHRISIAEGSESSKSESNISSASNQTIISAEDVGEIDPHGNGGPPTGEFMALMNIMKANLGPGILALPFAFKNSGLLVGIISVVVFGIICTHCMQIIVSAAHFFERKLDLDRQPVSAGSGCRRRVFSYQVVARLAFQHSPLHRWANVIHHLTISFLVITQMGFCCVYVVFVAQTVENILSEFTKVKPINIRYVVVMWAPLFLGLLIVRNLKQLAFLAMAANVVMISLLVVVYQEEIRHLPPISTVAQVSSISNFPRFFGTALYSFEGISCVLPVENKMLRPEKFGGMFGVLNRAMAIVTLMFGITGFLGYWAYGHDVAGSITYSLPSSNVVYLAVRIAAAVAVFICYAIQSYVPIQIILPYVRRRFCTANRRSELLAEVAVRGLFWLVSLGMALFIPHLAEFIGLVGAFGCTYLALILPPVIDLAYRYNMIKDVENDSVLQEENVAAARYGKFYWGIIKNLVILLIGVAGFGIGTYFSVSNIVEQFRLDALGNNTSS